MSKQKLLNASAMATLCALAAFSLQAKAQDREGMVVVRDAQTGKMRAPTPDELKALRPRAPATALSAGQSGPQPLAARRDGTRGVRLGDKTMVYDVVTRGADGKLSSECVNGDAAAEAALNRADPSSAGAPNGAPAANAHKEHAHETR